jgi:hypothetical protein
LHMWLSGPPPLSFCVRAKQCMEVISEFFDCPKCGRRNMGFARCQRPGCGTLRQDFRGMERVVAPELGVCRRTGSLTDVRLPNGEYLHIVSFLEWLRAGWLDENFEFTESGRAHVPEVP